MGRDGARGTGYFTSRSRRAAPRMTGPAGTPQNLETPRVSLRLVSRSVPVLAATALLCVAATRSAPPNMMPAPPPGSCNGQYALTGPGANVFQYNGAAGFQQPLPDGLAMASCSLHVEGTGWTSSKMIAVEWDPLTLAPDPTTVALRSQWDNPSTMSYYTANAVPWFRFSTPIVTRSVAGVADPPRTTVAIRATPGGGYISSALELYYEPEGSQAFPAASTFSAGGTVGTLEGTHPVSGHAICAAAELQPLRVAQSMRRTDISLVSEPEELLQRFRVPERVELRWIELAVAAGDTFANYPYPPAGDVAILDAEGVLSPPAQMPAPLIQSTFEMYYFFWTTQGYAPGPRWASHYPLDQTVVLEPGRDYWLHFRHAENYRMLCGTRPATESDAFQWGIGDFHTRARSTDPWSQVTGQALAFRIIGLPVEPVGVQPPPAPRGFALAVAPNPVRDVANVTWSGAVGPVKLEVLDVRGRRVGRGEGGAAGAWAMALTGRDGRPLPAGVYFVHARDSMGELAVERLVIVR